MNLYINRYADDFILGFQYRNEAERFFKECKEHLNKFGLVLHPDKTRLIAFGRFSAGNQVETKRETFVTLQPIAVDDSESWSGLVV